MKCLFGGAGMRREFLFEENAMLQRMLLQEQRERMSLQEQLHAERVKSALLEQEISHVAAAAQEMCDNLAQYFDRQSPADTQVCTDQDTMRPAHAGSPFAPPGASRQLQCIPEHTQKQQEILDYAEQVRQYAASLQQRLESTSPEAAAVAAEAAAAAAAAEPSAGPDAPAGDAQKVPSRAHSISVPSELQASMDLPLQALAVSRLALQLHQPQGPEDDASLQSRKSSCTGLGNSVEFGPSSSISSFPSLHFNQHLTASGAGMLHAPADAGGAAQHKAQQAAPMRDAAARCSVTRNAAAIAGSCASIAAAAAATAAAAAARKAAAAAALADRSQAQADLRASAESGFSSLTSPGSVSANLRQRREWQLAQEQWQQARQELSSAGSGNSSQATSAQVTTPEPPESHDQHAGTAAAADGTGSAGSNSSSSQQPCMQDSSVGQHSAAGVLPRLPAVPCWAQDPSLQALRVQAGSMQQHAPRVVQQQPGQLRYGSLKAAPATTVAAAGTASCIAAATASKQAALAAQSESTVDSRPPMRSQAAAAQQRATFAGPLTRSLSALRASAADFLQDPQLMEPGA